MKKTLSMIYRFVFILFSVWGICQKLGFNILYFRPEILDFTLFVDFSCFLCIFAVFIISITRKPGRVLSVIKTTLTLCAILVCMQNIPLINGGITYDWILGILLPCMMVLDWLLFDSRGNIKLYDPIIWLAAATAVFVALAALLKNVFGVENFWNALGMFTNNSELKNLLIKALCAGAGLYIIDCIGSALTKRSFNSAFSLIYRLVFLALEVYAISACAGKELTSFLYGLWNFDIFSNFLCAVCIAVAVIYNLVKFKSIKKNTTPFPRLKATFTISILATMVLHMVFYGEFFTFTIGKESVLFCIAPVMMLFDWILFDKKGSFKIYDPFLWLLIPLIYYLIATLYKIPYINADKVIFPLSQTEVGVAFFGAILVGGYVIYIADRLAAKQTRKKVGYG